MSNKIQSESEAAHLFTSFCSGRLRYVPERELWILRDGNLWNFDTAKGVEATIREFLDNTIDADARWRGSLALVRSIKQFAESDDTLHVSVTDIDTREELIGTASHVFSLRRMKRVKPKQETFITKRTAVDPDFETGCPRWLKFLNQIFKKDAEKISYFQRFCGYLLTGSTKEHRLLIIHGPGGNGKSVLVNTVAAIMGDYHTEALPETFVERKNIKHETAMAFISGARFVTSGETDQGGMLNEATVKRATGGDMVSARFLFKNPFTYRPSYKIWITTNHLPRLKSVGPDMRRRIHLLELDYIPAKPDYDLEKKLAQEHPAILAWMMEGAQAWLERSLDPPESITSSTDRYFSEQDTLGSWLTERTRSTPNGVTTSSALCDSYNRYLRERGIPEVESSLFGRMLSGRGYESKLARARPGTDRARCFFGIRLIMNT